MLVHKYTVREGFLRVLKATLIRGLRKKRQKHGKANKNLDGKNSAPVANHKGVLIRGFAKKAEYESCLRP